MHDATGNLHYSCLLPQTYCPTCPALPTAGAGYSSCEKTAEFGFVPKRNEGQFYQERPGMGSLEGRLLSQSWVVSTLSHTARAMQAPGSCRWREVLLRIVGMSPGRCEKSDSFCLLKLLDHSLVADKFPGILISHCGEKTPCRNQCDIKSDFASREGGEKLCL